MGAPGPAPADDVVLSPQRSKLFQQACAHCHLRPGIGVPVVGDEAAWKSRRAQGFDSLFLNTVTGIRGMPPLGSCNACTDADLRELVSFVSGVPPSNESGSAP